jgi:hypothetical protein
MAKDPEQLAHQEWLGYVQPVGLVVSVPALLAAQAYVNRNIVPDHQRFLSCLPRNKNDEVLPEINDLGVFTRTVLGWEPGDLKHLPTASTGSAAPGEFDPLEVFLPEYHETLRPTQVVSDGGRPMILVRASNADFDEPATEVDRGWHASPHAKFERLLRETGIAIGLLFNHTHLRLVYAPRGETSGYLTFSVAEMAQVAGRPIFAGLHLLLSAERLFSLPEKQRLPAILAESRKYQNTVSTQLAEQVLGALHELLRGFQAADDHRHGDLLRSVLQDDPNQVYAGLLNVLMRLVFILYAEDRGLLPADPVYRNHYAVTGLFERLREDAGHHPDTMDLRFGAWGQLLTLFRMIHDGGRHGGLKIPARDGYLFDPDRYPFLEGRSGDRKPDEKFDVPRVSDGVVFRVLSNLLILDSERLSYRTLDVEQIGSVYEAIMGFNLEVAQGRSIAIKAAKPHGAPSTINLEELLASKLKERAKWLRDRADQTLTGEALEKLQSAENTNDLLDALDRKIAKTVTPNVVPKSAMVLQPSDERRRSGSHYTPRSLTEPIVRTTLRPVLERLGEKPTPEQILELKVCDPAMGSGAFLVEACRQLADELVKAWYVNGRLPSIPPDEDEVLHARRLIAQRCLYGVDKNPMAVDLAKLSLWLATLAKAHPFTFVDHSLRCGDSLVGLSRDQIIHFHWKPGAQGALSADLIRKRVERATEYRRKILENAEGTPYLLLQQHLAVADEALGFVRFVGDAAVSAFFSEDTDRARQNKRDELFSKLSTWVSSGLKPAFEEPLTKSVKLLRSGERAIEPFHWEIEFPEAMVRESTGFDAVVGNPPFLGGARIWPSLGGAYADWIRHIHPKSEGRAVDLVAHFLRRSFNLLNGDGCLGLIGTNSVSQGDTREAGLKYICMNGGSIRAAIRRLRWPGLASVIVSVVFVIKRQAQVNAKLDGKDVKGINSFLFESKSEFEPARLKTNEDISFQGACVLGMGFTFDDADTSGVASSLAVLHDVIRQDPRNAERIFPYIGGKELNSNPTLKPQRYVIDFEDMSFEDASRWPILLDILDRRVKPARDEIGGYSVAERRRKYWWQFGTPTPALNKAKAGLTRVLAIARISDAFGFAFVPANIVCNEKMIVFVLDSDGAFALLQSRVHEMWARFFASTLKDDFQYTPADCFETFAFPLDWKKHSALHLIGKTYHDFRAEVMGKKNMGLTGVYNAFHDPTNNDSDILKLRELHATMDRTVLDAYGWTDLQPTCEFLLDYEEEEDDESQGRQRKKPWRYRWPDDFHDEVLARLLELNKHRAEEDRLTRASGAGKKERKNRSKRSEDGEQPTLSGI